MWNLSNTYEYTLFLSPTQAYASELPQRLAYHLFTYMLSVVPSSDQRPQVVNYYYFVVALSHVLKGTSTERARLIGSLASGGSGQVTTTHLIRVSNDWYNNRIPTD